MNKSILNLEPYSVFANMESPEPDWLWENTLALGSCTLLSGKPKAGKSTFVRHLIKAVINGESFLGKSTRKSVVVYLALEEQRGYVKQVFSKIGLDSNESLLLQVGGIDTSNSEQLIQELKETCEQYEVKLVIVDPLVKAVSNFDTNDYGQATSKTKFFLDFAHSLNVHVLLIHHTRKGEIVGQDSAVGSVGFSGGVDNTAILESSANCSTLSFKGRYIEEHDVLFKLDANQLILVDETTKQELLADRLLKELHKKDSQSLLDLRAKVECREDRVKKALNYLIEKGKICSEGFGTKGSKKLFKLNSPLGNDSGEEFGVEL